MKIAILSDIHADLLSLQDALRHIDREKCALVICAGDYVDYGPDADGTIALLQRRGAICIRGNHDRWGVSARRDFFPTPDATGRYAQLSSSSLCWLESLPAEWAMQHAGVGVAMWHASPGSDTRGITPERPRVRDIQLWRETCAAQVLVVGHTHRACELRAPDGTLVLNPGALLRTETLEAAGQVRLHEAWPVEGGTFGILELPSCRFTVRDGRDGREIPMVATRLAAAEPESLAR